MRSGLEAFVELLAERVADILLDRLRSEMTLQAPPVEDRLLDVAGVAERLSVPKNAVYKMAERGTLTAVKVGGRLRFRSSDVERFIANGTRSEERVEELAREARTVPAGGGRGCRSQRTSRSTGNDERRGAGDQREDQTLRVINTSPDDAPKRRPSG
jgi:excisionase family DNA binding protein